MAALLLCAIPSAAEYYNSLSGKAHHYLGISLGGGEANNAGKTLYNLAIPVSHIGGAAAGLSLLYEVQYHGWIIGLGIEGQYQYLRDTVADFVDADARIDRDGEAVMYGYAYHRYHETDHVAGIAVPVYFGKNFGNWVYALFGAKFSMPLWAQYNVQTDMATQGEYAWNIDPVRSDANNDFSTLGYYKKLPYAYANTYQEYMRVAVTAEVGANIPIPAKKARLRAGIYGVYGFRLGQSNDYNLADYSKVDKNPLTQSLADLQRNITWNASNTSHINSLPGNLEVGVKLTVLFDVTIEKPICKCVK